MAGKKSADDTKAVLAVIQKWPDPYRKMGKRIHAIILETVPELRPKLWYGMPGYAKAGPVLCFFRLDQYMTFGLSEKAHFSVQKGAPDQLMPSAWFLTKLDKKTEASIAAIILKAAG